MINHDPRLEIAMLKIEATGLTAFQPGRSGRIAAGCPRAGLQQPVRHRRRSGTGQRVARQCGGHQPTGRTPRCFPDGLSWAGLRCRCHDQQPRCGRRCPDRPQGRLAGILGKELRNALDNTWLNYSIPISELTASIDDMLAGRNPPRRDDENAKRPANPHTLRALGIVLVPDILAKTPPFVDNLLPRLIGREGGPAAGRPDPVRQRSHGLVLQGTG